MRWCLLSWGWSWAVGGGGRGAGRRRWLLGGLLEGLMEGLVSERGEGVRGKGDLPVRLVAYSCCAWRRAAPVRFAVENKPGLVSRFGEHKVG